VERSDTHQLHFVEVMGFAGLNPSCGLTTSSSDLPVGLFVDRRVESFFSEFPKNICCHLTKSNLELSHPTPPEGRIMIVTDAGRDAVDAAAFCARRDGRAS
jgi:hypothetical protein